MTPSRTRLLALGAAVAAGALLLLHAGQRLPFLADDALISLRYTDRLLDGQGLTWTAGERVEGYSNLLWVLLAAVPGLLGFDLVAGVRALGALAALATVAALVWPHRDRPAPWAVAALLVAASGPVAVWTLAGLETPLVAALLAWALAGADALARRPRSARTWPCSLPLALLAVTRPDGIVLGSAVAAGVLLARRRAAPADPRDAFATAARVLAPALATLLLQTAFRLLYYRDVLPNTAYAKLGFAWRRLGEGAAHVGAGLADLWPLAALGAAGLVLAARRGDARGRAWPAVAVAALWPAYVAFVGGDVFPGYRHLVPLVVALAWGAALGLDSLDGRRRRAGLAAAVVAALAFGAWQVRHDAYRPGFDAKFVGWGEALAGTLREAYADRDPLLAVSAAGCLPYYTGFRSLDILGLCDRHLAHHRPDDFGSGPLAHELGDAGYVLDREPDILVVGPPGPGLGRQLGGRYDDELVGDPRFLDEYRLVRLGVGGPEPFTAFVWLRQTSDRIGWRFADGRIVVPAVFCNGNPDTVARPGPGGGLVVRVDPATPALLALGPDARRITGVAVEPADAAVQAGVVRDEQGAPWLRVTATRPVDVARIVLQVR